MLIIHYHSVHPPELSGEVILENCQTGGWGGGMEKLKFKGGGNLL